MINGFKLKHLNKAAAKERPDRILDDLEIKPGSIIGDIGSGRILYTAVCGKDR